MFKRLADIFSNFFGSLFGGKTSDGKPTSDKRPPTPHDKEPDLIEDSSDVPVDTVLTIEVMDIEIHPTDTDAGPFADRDKEGAFDDTDGAEPEPEPQPEPEPEAPPVTEPEPAGPVQPAHKPRFLWCLDNGHGKLQAGKRSPVYLENDIEIQFLEYEFNRDVVERIMRALDEKGVQYFDVVPDFLEVGSFLRERVERANKKQSDLPKIFVSVHSNAGPAAAGAWVINSIQGAETWFAHNSSKGQKIASVFQRHIVAKTGFRDRKLKSTKEKSLYVLVKTIMPAVLTENGFYNNKEEVKKLMKDSFRQKIADAHIDAILEIEKHGIR